MTALSCFSSRSLSSNLLPRIISFNIEIYLQLLGNFKSDFMDLMEFDFLAISLDLELIFCEIECFSDWDFMWLFIWEDTLLWWEEFSWAFSTDSSFSWPAWECFGLCFWSYSTSLVGPMTMTPSLIYFSTLSIEFLRLRRIFSIKAYYVLMCFWLKPL